MREVYIFYCFRAVESLNYPALVTITYVLILNSRLLYLYDKVLYHRTLHLRDASLFVSASFRLDAEKKFNS
ncbi:MAG: hypothetical protein WAL53_04900, partial [Nitrososphaeraceae archaeon]